MALPNFVCAGAQRSGTTTLYFLLQQHDDVFVTPHWKEPHFFDNPFNFEKGLAHYELENFFEHQSETAIGDITPSYMVTEPVVERLFDALGADLKLIFCLRNPAARAFSQYLLNRARLWEKETFEQALALEAERVTQGVFHFQRSSYQRRGLYHRHLTRFLERFPREQMSILIYEEDFGDALPSTMAGLFDFLGVAPQTIDLGVHANRSQNPKVHRFAEPVTLTAESRNPGQGKQQVTLPAGGLAFDTPGRGAKLIHRPSPALNRFLEDWEATAPETTTLDPQYQQALIEQVFLEDIKALEELIERDLSVWYAGGDGTP